MKIRMITSGGLNCPVALCDVCDGIIDAETPGHALYNPETGEVPYVVHRGRCDRQVDPLPSSFYWSPLSPPDDDAVFEGVGVLAQLLHNYTHPMKGADR